MTNVDNINVDQVPFLIESLMKKGAGNVHVVPAFTKKGRQEYIFLIDTPEEHVTVISRFLASEISTLGIRILNAEHMAFAYSMENKKIKLKDSERQVIWEGSIPVKIVKDEEGTVFSVRAEYEDLKRVSQILHDKGSMISFYELKQMVEAETVRDLKDKRFKIEFDS